MEAGARGGVSANGGEQEYRVILESVDPDKETPETFALKLSMSIRSPLPRIMSVVNNMPAAVGGRMGHKRAKHLAGLIEELGGRSRIEAQADTGESRSPGPEKSPPRSHDSVSSHDTGPEDGEAGQQSAAGGEAARQKAPPLICPHCGWEGDAGAKFCPTCSFAFNKDNGVNPESPGFESESDNPLAESDDHASIIDKLLLRSGLGQYVRAAILLVLICILLSLLSDLQTG